MSNEVKRIVPRIPVLKEREKTHGSYVHVANLAQNLKTEYRKYSGWTSLNSRQQESLDLIATKIARILNGNPNEIDHWKDIAGYATLVVEIFERKS